MTTPHLVPADADAVRLWITGTPVPQGSKKAMPIYRKVGGKRVFTGKIVVVEELEEKLKPWRKAVAVQARRQYRGLELLDGDLSAAMFFAVPRPPSVTRGYPNVARTVGDLSKLTRAVEDSLTGVVWVDDARVVNYHGQAKVYAGGPYLPGMPELAEPGVWIEIMHIGPALSRRRVAPRQGQPDPEDLERLRDGRLSAEDGLAYLFGHPGAA